MDDVGRMGVFLTTPDHFAAMNSAYAEYWGDAEPPARTTVFVGLPAGMLVEIDAVAVR
jgi:enamine deaminase RidA (YjgF/YER057c/UK114 family)